MKALLIVAGAVLLAALAFGGLTLYALEGQVVVVVRTHAPDGSLRETRTWVADDDGALWIEAAFVERPFYQQMLADPSVEIVRDGVTRRGRAVLVPNPDGHRHVRALLASKYGWADCWVGWLQDTSRSVAVRIEPE